MDPTPAAYAIRIRGHLGDTVLSAFPVLESRRHGADTVLTGLLDRSALYGVLAEVEALGLDLVEVRRLMPSPRSVRPLPYGPRVIPRNAQILDQIRAEALARDIPADDVRRWLELVRPCALLTGGGDGPVVGRFGGPVLLPPGAEDPWFPLIATIDCAALPPDTTDLALPADGRLLLFGFPDVDAYASSMGEVVYVPAGAEVEERAAYPPHYPLDENAEIYQEFPRGELHLTADISLPFAGTVELQEAPWSAPLPGHPHSEALAEVWADQWGGAPLVIGGYGTDFNGGDSVGAAAFFAVEAEKAGTRPGSGPTSPHAEDWVLLAECHVSRPGGASIFWAIQRDDLIASRFDRAQVVVDWNP